MRFPWFRRGREKATEHVQDFERLLRIEAEVESLKTTWIAFKDTVRSQLANAAKRARRETGEEAEPTTSVTASGRSETAGPGPSASARDYSDARAMGLIGRRPR